VTVLSDSGKPQYIGRCLDISGSGMCLSMPVHVPLNAALRIESGDWLLLGEVCRSMMDRGCFKIAVQLRHSLIGISELEPALFCRAE
jgi:hypothetical protein